MRYIMKRKSTLYLALLTLLFAIGPSYGQRFLLPVQEEKESKELVERLKNYRVQFYKLLEMRKKVDSWEKNLRATEKVVYEKQKLQLHDLKMVRSGKLTEDSYKTKWIDSGRQAKTLLEVQKFRKDIADYNNYRVVYNNLAKKLAKHLQNRKLLDVKHLVKNIELLIAKLQRAINSEDFVQASKIAKNSRLAQEFNYPFD